MLIVESLSTGKRIPAYSHDKVISLADIAMFTVDGETPLNEVMNSVKEKENGAVASVSLKSTADEYRKWFAEILPNFDRERVYPSDIKKLITWYNILTEAGLNDFLAKDEEIAEETAE